MEIRILFYELLLTVLVRCLVVAREVHVNWILLGDDFWKSFHTRCNSWFDSGYIFRGHLEAFGTNSRIYLRAGGLRILFMRHSVEACGKFS